MSSKLDKSTKVNVKVVSKPSPKGNPPKPSAPSVSASKIAATDQLQGRDTIYIDIDDDVTSIIGKIKSSENTVIALVPPKRTGALQSVVNLKLLQQAAKNNRKKVALITTDNVLSSMASALSIPIARNLTSQPKLLEVEEPEIEEDNFIDGKDIAVGDLAKMGKTSRANTGEDKEISAAVKAIETDDKINDDLDADGEPDSKPQPKSKEKKSRVIPNFDTFRKKLMIFGGLGLAFIIFLVWAIWFAPGGTITISAKTSSKAYKVSVNLDPNSSTTVDKAIIQPVVKQTKKTETVSFTATGTKDIGDKATGKVVIHNDYSLSSFTLPAGTVIATSSGLQYTLSSSVVVPSVTGTLYNPQTGTSNPVTAVASNIGENYNVKSGTKFSVSGQNSKVKAEAKGDFTGGTKETVKVVQQSDLDAVVDTLRDQADSESVKSDLESQMGSNVTVIDDSFTASYADATSKPAVGEPASSGSATATMEITYTMIGITTSDLEALADSQAGALVEDESSQKVYDNGLKDLKFTGFAATDSAYTVIVNSNAKIGPVIDVAEIKERAVGKRSGEIVSDIESISGVSNVQVKFSPFWVGSVSDQSKLKVEFTVDE